MPSQAAIVTDKLWRDSLEIREYQVLFHRSWLSNSRNIHHLLIRQQCSELHNSRLLLIREMSGFFTIAGSQFTSKLSYDANSHHPRGSIGDTSESQATSVETQLPLTASAQAPSQRWKMVELRVLISLKKDEYEKSLNDTPRERIKSADARWKIVTAGLLRYGFNRKQALIRKKWEKLMTDFKKIFDYQRRPPSGELGYFEMGSDDRKRFNLPPQYDNEVYKLMECWVPARRAVQPDSEQLMDSSIGEGEGQPAPAAGGTPQTSSAGGSQAEPATAEGDQLPVGEGNSDSSAIPDHPSAQGRVLKKSKRDRLDDHFKNANGELVKAMATQAEKKELSDKAFLDWDRKAQSIGAT